MGETLFFLWLCVRISLESVCVPCRALSGNVYAQAVASPGLRVPSCLPGGRAERALVCDTASVAVTQLDSKVSRSVENTPDALLRILEKCKRPVSCSEIAKLAPHFNLRHEALLAFEQQLFILDDDATRSSSAEERLAHAKELNELLNQVSERDLALAAKRHFSNEPSSKKALALQIYGHVCEAQKVHAQSMQAEVIKSGGTHPTPGTVKVTETSPQTQRLAFELELCESEWLECARELHVNGALDSCCLHLEKLVSNTPCTHTSLSRVSIRKDKVLELGLKK